MSIRTTSKRSGLQEVEGQLAVLDDHRGDAHRFQDQLDDLLVGRMVLGHQHAGAGDVELRRLVLALVVGASPSRRSSGT